MDLGLLGWFVLWVLGGLSQPLPPAAPLQLPPSALRALPYVHERLRFLAAEVVECFYVQDEFMSENARDAAGLREMLRGQERMVRERRRDLATFVRLQLAPVAGPVGHRLELVCRHLLQAIRLRLLLPPAGPALPLRLRVAWRWRIRLLLLQALAELGALEAPEFTAAGRPPG